MINGPNLNLLAERQPEIYGSLSLGDIEQRLRVQASARGFALEFHQSNHEGEIVELLQRYRRDVAGIIINPAAYSHTSVAILDALLTVVVPVIEVHLSNIYRREEFRRQSLTARACVAVISGLGPAGYDLALTYLIDSFRG